MPAREGKEGGKRCPHPDGEVHGGGWSKVPVSRFPAGTEEGVPGRGRPGRGLRRVFWDSLCRLGRSRDRPDSRCIRGGRGTSRPRPRWARACSDRGGSNHRRSRTRDRIGSPCHWRRGRCHVERGRKRRDRTEHWHAVGDRSLRRQTAAHPLAEQLLLDHDAQARSCGSCASPDSNKGDSASCVRRCSRAGFCIIWAFLPAA